MAKQIIGEIFARTIYEISEQILKQFLKVFSKEYPFGTLGGSHVGVFGKKIP